MLDTYLRFLPVTAFVLCYKFYNWQTAFLVGGLISTFQIAFFVYKRIPFNRFVLAVNLFLLTGALAIVTNFQPLLEWYGYLQQTTLFLWLFIVGAVTTFTPRGFINVNITYRYTEKKIIEYSFILLGATALAILFSWKFHAQYFLSTAVPFLALIMFNAYLVQHYHNNPS